MFTGLIEEVGKVVSVRRTARAMKLAVGARTVLSETIVGDSICVSGVCLTVIELRPDQFVVDVVPETVKRSTLQWIGAGEKVNLERAMRADGRFGGHIVAGHVDGVGTVTRMVTDDFAQIVTITSHPSVIRYVVEKGSIAIDGVSLTVMRVEEDSFTVSIIPHTATVTLFSELRIGDRVNLEVDVIGKYVERLLTYPDSKHVSSNGLTRDILQQWGY